MFFLICKFHDEFYPKGVRKAFVCKTPRGVGWPLKPGGGYQPLAYWGHCPCPISEDAANDVLGVGAML